MSDVKRYDCNGIECSADYSHMRFVLATDYDALAQRCAELEEDLAEQSTLLKAVSEQRDFLDKLQSDGHAFCTQCGSSRDAIAELRALLAGGEA